MKTNNVVGALPPVVRDVLSVPKKVGADLKSLYQQFQSEVIKPVKSTSVSHARSLYREGKWGDASKVFEAIGDRNRAMYCLHRALEAKEGAASENYKKIAELYSSVGKTERAKRYVKSSDYQLVRENKRSVKGFIAKEGLGVSVEKFVGVVGDMIKDDRATFEDNLERPGFKQELLAAVDPRPVQTIAVAKKEDGDVRRSVLKIARSHFEGEGKGKDKVKVEEKVQARNSNQFLTVHYEGSSNVAKAPRVEVVEENVQACNSRQFLTVRYEGSSNVAKAPRVEVAEQKKPADKAERPKKVVGVAETHSLSPAIKNSLLANDPGCVPLIGFLANKDKKWNNVTFVKEQLYEASTKETFKETYFREKCFDYFKDIYGKNKNLWTLLGSPKNFGDLAMVLYTPSYDPFDIEKQLKLFSYSTPAEQVTKG